MAKMILHNIGQLVTCAGKAPKRGPYLRELAILLDAAVVIDGETIKETGHTQDILERFGDEIKAGEYAPIDVESRLVCPGFVDPHTHALFVGSRQDEFEMRLEGKAYMDILLGGGGILNTVNKVQKSTEDDLIRETSRRLDRMLKHGTTTVEIKSGYGLDTENELKMLRAIKRLGEVSPIETKSTFLGAHAIPFAYKNRKEEYVDLICKEMIPAVVKEGNLADFCDVFCEQGVFSLADSRLILEAAKAAGLRLKIHADEIEPLGGTQLACELGAQSADHLLSVSEKAIGMLSSGETVAVCLPGTAFSLMAPDFAPARKMVDRGVAVALATDCNPGSCYTESMQIIISLSCLRMKLTPAEALNAATINAACALGLQDKVGSIEKGKQADLLVLDIPDYKYLPYHFGVNHVQTVIKRGEIVVEREVVGRGGLDFTGDEAAD